MPTEFRESFLGTTNTYQFNVYKVINQDEKTLMAMDNPFAIVVLTVLLALKKDKSNEIELIDLKMDFNFYCNKPKLKASNAAKNAEKQRSSERRV